MFPSTADASFTEDISQCAAFFSLSILSVSLDVKMCGHCTLVLSVFVGAADWTKGVMPVVALPFFCADGLVVLVGLGGGSLL